MREISNRDFQPKMNVFNAKDFDLCDSSFCHCRPQISSVDCCCAEQIKYVISQLIILYPTVDITVTTDTGDDFTGRPNALIPVAYSSGMFTLANSTGVVIHAISLCKIAKISVPSTTLYQGISYLTSCHVGKMGCEANCEAAIRNYLSTFASTDFVQITTSDDETSIGKIYKNERGIVTLIARTTEYIIFISTCKIESVSPYTNGG